MIKIDKICSHTFISDYINHHSVIVDLGVNHGWFTETILDRYDCTVYGAEPVPSLYSSLPKLKNMFVYPLAISNYDGGTTLQVNPNRCASILETLKENGGEDIEVKCMTLDSFISRHITVQKIDLLKMDIEGAEIKVLKVCSEETIKRIGMLTIEFHDFLDQRLTQAVDEIHLRMNGLGFYRINFSHDNTDCLYVNLSMHNLSVMQKVTLIVRKYLSGFIRVINR